MYTLVINETHSGTQLKKTVALDMEWPRIHDMDALLIQVLIRQEVVLGHTATIEARISPAEVREIIHHPVTLGLILLETFHDLTTVKLNVPWDAAVPNQARMISCCRTLTNTVKYQRRKSGQ